MALIINGEELDMSPKFWEAFAGWWGDKAHRQSWDAQELELTAREYAANSLQELLDDYDYNDGDMYDSDYTLGVAEGFRRAINHLRQAPKTSKNLVWSYGELVPEGEENLDD